jgi:hypothetical protein
MLPFRQSESVADPLTELAREGARRMLAEALKAEADAFVASFAHEQLEDGRQRIVRHGFGPERQIQTGIGALDVQRPKVRDRMVPEGPAEKIRFTSHILPKWARRTVSLDALLPVLYLKGISTGDFQEALSAILGPDAPNLSPSVVSRLTAADYQDGAGDAAECHPLEPFGHGRGDGYFAFARGAYLGGSRPEATPDAWVQGLERPDVRGEGHRYCLALSRLTGAGRGAMR